MLEEGLARQPFERRQPAIIAIELVSLVAFVQQETEPGGRRLEDRRSDFWITLEETRHQHHRHPQRRLSLEILNVGQEIVRKLRRTRRQRNQFRSRVLLGVSWRLNNTQRWERMHAIDHSG